MKSFLLATLLLSGPAAWAQSAPASSASLIKYRYCFVVIDDRYFSRPHNLAFYYRATPNVPVDAELEEAATQIQKAPTLVFALNYLGNLGWECFSVTNVASETSASGYFTSETRYMFRQPN
jgi:hypothetical protein